MTTLTGEILGSTEPTQALSAFSDRWLNRIGLFAVAALAAVLRFYNLQALGYANHYYTAAIVAMLQSWHNFFFVAAEPGGSVSIDKPPVGLWLQTISAYFFGVNGFGVLLPQLLAGIASVFVVYHLVQRTFGKAAGLVAGLALAITPVVIATDRNNTMDSTLILTLLLAAWAFVKATETARLRFLLLGAVLVGIGFNIKMLEAFLPLPAFFALYFLGTKERWWKKLGKLSLASVVLLAVSLSWAVAVDLTPADQRPYVGSSSDNSEMSLIIGYNGMERLLGMGGRGGLLSNLFRNTTGGNTGNGNPPQPRQDGNSNTQPRQDGNGGFPGGFGGAPTGGPGGFGGGAPGGFFNTGNPGPLRLFIAPLSNQMSWLLPFAIFSAVFVALGSRLRWPVTAKHQALVLWGGWLLTGGVFFSVAGFFHEYYLSMLAPALAALVGMGVATLWGWRTKHPWLAIALTLSASAMTIWYQYMTASSFISPVLWIPLAVMLLLVGAVLLFASVREQAGRMAAAGMFCVVASLMLTPGIWSALTNRDASTNQTLPAAYNGGQASFGPAGRGGAGTPLTGVQVNSALLNYLQANTQGMKYMVAVPSSMQGADYVIVTGRGILYLGGFNGGDQVETPDSLAKLVADGELRYIYLENGGFGGGPGGGQQSSIAAWVRAHGKAVTGYDANTANQGAPDGIGSNATGNAGGFGGGFGGTRVTLYDLKANS